MNPTLRTPLRIASALVLAGGLLVQSAPVSAGADPDPNGVCNAFDTIVQWDASFPAGTIKAGVSPEFTIVGGSGCHQDFNGRIVTVTTGYVFQPGTNILVQVMAPRTEISKEVRFRADAAFNVKNKLNSFGINQVTQMRSVVELYHSTQFDANGRLLPGATPLGTDTVGWTQTNFITL